MTLLLVPILVELWVHGWCLIFFFDFKIVLFKHEHCQCGRLSVAWLLPGACSRMLADSTYTTGHLISGGIRAIYMLSGALVAALGGASVVLTFWRWTGRIGSAASVADSLQRAALCPDGAKYYVKLAEVLHSNDVCCLWAQLAAIG